MTASIITSAFVTMDESGILRAEEELSMFLAFTLVLSGLFSMAMVHSLLVALTRLAAALTENKKENLKGGKKRREKNGKKTSTPAPYCSS